MRLPWVQGKPHPLKKKSKEQAEIIVPGLAAWLPLWASEQGKETTPDLKEAHSQLRGPCAQAGSGGLLHTVLAVTGKPAITGYSLIVPAHCRAMLKQSHHEWAKRVTRFSTAVSVTSGASNPAGGESPRGGRQNPGVRGAGRGEARAVSLVGNT